MKECIRIEIVIEQSLVAKFEAIMHKLDNKAYTLITNISGLGERGHRRADELTGTSANCLIIIASDDPQQTERIVDAVRPLLKSSGGMCLISEAKWLKH